MADPPTYDHLLRSHSTDVTALFFSSDNERLYSGDASGRVVVTSTRSLRPITSWPAHTDSILGIEEWKDCIITHSRDHKLFIWTRIQDLPASERVGGSAAFNDLPTPSLVLSMDVNALNFCRFSLLPSTQDALIAIPNLVESSEADIWSLPAQKRIHASVGTQRKQSIFSLEGREGMKTGIIMSLHLFRAPPPIEGSSEDQGELRLVTAYEDGSVTLRRFVGNGTHTGPDIETSIEGRGWEVIWRHKLHVESIMAMRVSRDNTFALTVSADHIVGRYELLSDSSCITHRTKHPKNGCIAIRDDGRVCAIGGWDGKVRLYSTKTMKPLGTLRYHKSGCQAVEFAHTLNEPVGNEDEEFTWAEREARGRWLAVASKDNRVSLWTLISFEKR
ncbi:WD40 repeat-containing protein [Mycena indigotica]|uniref:ASTRA-associated protein 1 n=1 Tax=Mycena indigotica TaxID=2126181 RepID=A0A8H6T8D8_9AGAR|nr:WD40 repeat-containing protein [Mycena indigotica]KAF7312232.1 WD40 repeat-containing protein [Mycena indigotica]